MTTKHGHVGTPTYKSWEAMKDRCLRPKHRYYRLYGGRGITVCERWRESFPEFLADMGERPPGTTLDRIDNNGNYEPGNCRWATRAEQYANRSTNRIIEWNGERLPLFMWAKRLGLTDRALFMRIHHGWPLERMMTQPMRKRRAAALLENAGAGAKRPECWSGPLGPCDFHPKPERGEGERHVMFFIEMKQAGYWLNDGPEFRTLEQAQEKHEENQREGFTSRIVEVTEIRRVIDSDGGKNG